MLCYHDLEFGNRIIENVIGTRLGRNETIFEDFSAPFHRGRQVLSSAGEREYSHKEEKREEAEGKGQQK